MEALPVKTSVYSGSNEFFWKTLPDIVRKKVSATLGDILTDGQYLSTYIKSAWIFPPILFLVGLLIGGDHFGFDKSYVDSMSITLIIFMFALSMWGAAFGFWLWLGYAFGELFIYSFLEFAGS